MQATCPALLILPDSLTVILVFVEEHNFLNSSLRNFLQPPATSSLSGQSISLEHPVLKHLPRLKEKHQVKRPYKAKGKITSISLKLLTRKLIPLEAIDIAKKQLLACSM
jgi:hypothetical protein